MDNQIEPDRNIKAASGKTKISHEMSNKKQRKLAPFKGQQNQQIELFMARICTNKKEIPKTSKTKAEDESDLSFTHGDARDLMAENFRSLYRDLELERAARSEAEKAFHHLMSLYNDMKAKWKSAAASSKQAFDIADQMKQKYCEHKALTENNLSELERANETLDILKQLLTKEKRKTDALRAQLNILRTPADHSACDLVLEQERTDRKNALEKIKKLCEELEEVKAERDNLKQSNREMKEKMVTIVNIKNELVQQNKTLMMQRNTLQFLVDDKDRQLARLREHLDRDILQEPIVQAKIAEIEECERKKRKALDDEIGQLKNTIDELQTKIKELESMVETRTTELKAMCREYEAFKRQHLLLVEQLQADLQEKENNIISIIEIVKEYKIQGENLKTTNENQGKEIAGMREEIRLKDVEITVLAEAKTLLEDKIKMYKCEKEAMHELAMEFEHQIECTRATMKELENYKYAIKRQLREAEEELQQQKENNYIQEKILEDNRETVKMLRCRLKECCQQLNKCEREKEVLLCERQFC